MSRKLLLAFAFLLLSGVIHAQFFKKPEAQQRKEAEKPELPEGYENRTDDQGRRQGKWMKFHPNGNPAYKATFEDGTPVDTLTRYYPDGSKYVEIVFDDNGLWGRGKFFSQEGDMLAEGRYLNMEKDSVWRFYDKKGNLTSKEVFEDDVRHGKSRIFFDDGTIAAEVTYKNGKKDGREKRFYHDGSPRVYITHKDGKKHGSYKVFYTNGEEEIEGRYNNDRRDSTWVFYDASGYVNYKIEYENGEPVNKDQLDSLQREKFERFERNRKRLKDPEQYRNNPEEYIQGF